MAALARHNGGYSPAYGGDPLSVSGWLIVSDTRTNRRRLDTHMAVIRNALPAGTWAIRRWLRRPKEAIGAQTVWPAAG